MAKARAWRRRRYSREFINKLLLAESEVAETRVWVAFASELQFADPKECLYYDRAYRELLVSIERTRLTSHHWTNFDKRELPSQ